MLRMLKIDADMEAGEHWAIAFAVGFGVLGWAVFPLGVAGYLSEGPLTVLLSAGALAAVLLRRKGRFDAPPRLDAVGRALMVLLGVVLAFDLAEGLAPPADADTLSYHFNLPKRFLESGRIEFIPLVVEGAIPMLVQMTYVPALALGGEGALTLWTMTSGWAAGVLLFILCRPHLGFNWCLAVTLVFLTTPAVVYGGGSGQVETRITLFVMTAAWATARAIETGNIRYAVLAGLGCGFFAAAKYTGLLFAAVAGIVILFHRRWLVHGAIFGAALLAAGFQWYAWNGIHTGDPVFPALFQWLGREDLVPWTKAHDLVFKQHLFKVENPLPQTLPWLVLFPFSATLGFAEAIDYPRVGFGPYGLLVLPFAALGLWRFRDRIRRGPLLTYASLAILFYGLWFFAGGSQRIRHLVPILPLFLICVTAAAARLTTEGRHLKPLLAAVAATVFLQMGGHGLFALNYLKFLVRGEDRDTFLARNIEIYESAAWINANLTAADRLYMTHRAFRYFLDVPIFFGSATQASVEMRPEKTDVRKLYRQLRSQGVTHFLLGRAGTPNIPTYPLPVNLLDRAGCLIRVKSFTARPHSRTLPTWTSALQTTDVLKLGDESCLNPRLAPSHLKRPRTLGSFQPSPRRDL